MTRPTTLGELRESGYEPRPVKEEMRRNLIANMQREDPLFPGIIGFEDTVIPQIEIAILAGHDMTFLGERGQAKTRLIRALTSLLDEQIPTITGSEIHDDPFNPISKFAKEAIAEQGDRTPIRWVPRDERYAEKLATPDVTTADLIGEVDPIKVAEGRYLADEHVIHYGLIPRANRGIFCINELPDLSERIQVGLFNIMEERDVQIRGFKIRLPLDVYIVASANPEDYTNRGRIITPLKDRYGAQIRTHYPLLPEMEVQVMEQERTAFTHEGVTLTVPQFMKEIVAEITREAREHAAINQRSGVSVRMSICNYESLCATAIRRAICLGEKFASPRISDLRYLAASSMGKIEVEAIEEDEDGKILDELLRRAVRKVFNQYLSVSFFDPFITLFDSGTTLLVGNTMKSGDYIHLLNAVEGLKDGVMFLGSFEEPAAVASAVEFILEGLHLNRKLNKYVEEDTWNYRGNG